MLRCQLLLLVQFAMELFDFLPLAFYFAHLRFKIYSRPPSADHVLPVTKLFCPSAKVT